MDVHGKINYGVSWGDEVLSDGQNVPQLECTKQYTSFFLEGNKYCLYDAVYLRSPDGPPYIARIGSLYENVKKKVMNMNVRWFCRPRELPLGIGGVNYEDSCKEVFLAWGTGSKNVVNPASTITKCNVICTAENVWSTKLPSEEQIAAADHIFRHAFDMTSLKLQSLDVVVRQFGEDYVTGVGGRRAPDKKPAAEVIGLHQEGPQPLVIPMDPGPLPKHDLRPNALVQRPATVLNNISLKARKRPRVESLSPIAEHNISKKPKLNSSELIRPTDQARNVSLLPKAGKSDDKTRLKCPAGPVWSLFDSKRVLPQEAEVKIQDCSQQQSPECKLGGDRRLPSKKIWNVPWHRAVDMAIEKGKALLLQNLDPWFSSYEIEEMLTQLLRVCCEVRMLPPKDFLSYTSGEAVVLFESQEAAEDSFTKFTENVLIWSKDERPLVVSIASKSRYETSPFHGFLNLDKFSATKRYTQHQGKNWGTAHCSQPNTLEYELGLQWRLLQSRRTHALTLAEQEQKYALKDPVLKTKH